MRRIDYAFKPIFNEIVIRRSNQVHACHPPSGKHLGNRVKRGRSKGER